MRNAEWGMRNGGARADGADGKGNLILAARAAWVDGHELRQDVSVVVRDGRVVEVLPQSEFSAEATANTVKCDGVLIPGLINAHAHIEYTHLRGALPRGSGDFGDWLDAIYAAKRIGGEPDYAASAADGMRLLAEGGCTAVADSFHRPEAASASASSPLRVVALRELIALDSRTAGVVAAEAEAFLAAPTQPGWMAAGLNPHAPYTVGVDLRESLLKTLTAHPDALCAWHLCETTEEDAMFRAGGGGLARFYARRGVPMPFAAVPECGPSEFLLTAGLLDRCDAAFHLNIPAPGDGAFFASPRLVVHCPGTHTFFARPPFPLRELQAAGANVALGTDSLASGDSLSMLEMLRMAAAEFPWLDGADLLDLATRNPGRARLFSGAAAPLGVIVPEAAADFAVLGPWDSREMDIHAIITNPRTRVETVFVEGRMVAGGRQ